IEADRRKAGFLTHVCGLFGLAGVTVDPRRAEVAGHDPALREHFDLAVSRAAAPPPLLCELSLPLVKAGGGLWALVADAGAAASACGELPPDLGAGTPIAVAPGVLHVPKLTATAGRWPPPRWRAHPTARRRRR
ncbi:MAG: class I SAM-dependent methyltransferase, partial [Candidatus Dormibacteraeota bacterium]|nr:class I SAM-dependent methyltransferase [Candidatus Dormibacteraeota bacterium]